MPALTSIALGIAAVAAVAGTVYSIEAQQDAADKEEKLMKQMAADELEAGKSEAENIRRQALRMKKQQEASMAGSGVLLSDEGTPDFILGETSYLSELDALAALKGSKNKAGYYRSKGAMAQDRADSYAVGSFLSLGGNLANMGYNYSNYKKTVGGGSGFNFSETPSESESMLWH